MVGTKIPEPEVTHAPVPEAPVTDPLSAMVGWVEQISWLVPGSTVAGDTTVTCVVFDCAAQGPLLLEMSVNDTREEVVVILKELKHPSALF